MVMLLSAIYNVQLLPNINREKTKITGCNLLFETKYKDNENKQCCGSSVQNVKNVKSRLDPMGE